MTEPNDFFFSPVAGIEGMHVGISTAGSTAAVKGDEDTKQAELKEIFFGPPNENGVPSLLVDVDPAQLGQRMAELAQQAASDPDKRARLNELGMDYISDSRSIAQELATRFILDIDRAESVQQVVEAVGKGPASSISLVMALLELMSYTFNAMVHSALSDENGVYHPGENDNPETIEQAIEDIWRAVLTSLTSYARFCLSQETGRCACGHCDTDLPAEFWDQFNRKPIADLITDDQIDEGEAN